ncbi:MAG: alpha-glucan family phosphorylase [Acidobacteriia bacterium]|nr:alpha-glucan family phosphorylase [Terriglobia bacterium]
MNFQVKPLQEFLVRPALPQALSRMNELAYNLLWSWDHTLRALFRRLDPAIWRSSGHNPVLMLGQLSQAALERAAADARYLTLYRHACERLDAYRDRYKKATKQGAIAYFCMEFGLVDCMPTYSGGLGILAGDHLKAASDRGLPLVGVGLLYQQGYFRQFLNPDGWQQERNPVNDFYTLPLKQIRARQGGDLKVTVDMPTGKVHIKVWELMVGCVPLYLLDTNIAENELQENRGITSQLYGGDIVSRIRQEIVLGIGGLRALKVLGIEPTVYHMNEGHSAFLAIERIRLLMQDHGLSFEEALHAARCNNVFTTHTAVPAGFDLFDPGLLHEYFQAYLSQAGIPPESLLSLGRNQPSNQSEPFSMALSAIHTSAYRNAVSRLHRTVSQEMFQSLWGELPTWEIPITSVTNGVHLPTWLSSDLSTLYDQYLQPDWLERYLEPKTWDLIRDIPDAELWEARRRRKRRLIQFVRDRVQTYSVKRKASASELRRLAEVLDPDAFTIGFSRRFATYKRATLLFRDIDRLKRILNNPDMPVQVLVAGKAHPKDQPGKTFIREIWNLSRDPEVSRRIVFVEDYSIQVGRELVQGVDLWLNNPRRGEEACGTSGMKAGINGVLNLSILDGWFDEAYELSGGWAIGDREPYSEDQDEFHASSIYSLLENEIVPMFYRDRDGGVPEEWIRRVKQSLMSLSPIYNCNRMVAEYNSQMYRPAHEAWSNVSRDGFQPAKDHAAWLARVRSVWQGVRFLSVSPHLAHPALSGESIPFQAVLDLAGLSPTDVRVEAVVGHVGVEGNLENTTVLILPAIEQREGQHVFGKEFVPENTGRLGYAVRISANHSDDPLTRPCNMLLKWAQI